MTEERLPASQTPKAIDANQRLVAPFRSFRFRSGGFMPAWNPGPGLHGQDVFRIYRVLSAGEQLVLLPIHQISKGNREMCMYF